MESPTTTVSLAALGSRIKKQRRKLRLSQSVLAEQCDLTESYISRIETGTKVPSVRTLASIATALNTSMDYLVFGSVACDNCKECITLSALLAEYPPLEQKNLLDFMKITTQFFDQNTKPASP